MYMIVGYYVPKIGRFHRFPRVRVPQTHPAAAQILHLAPDHPVAFTSVSEVDGVAAQPGEHTLFNGATPRESSLQRRPDLHRRLDVHVAPAPQRPVRPRESQAPENDVMHGAVFPPFQPRQIVEARRGDPRARHIFALHRAIRHHSRSAVQPPLAGPQSDRRVVNVKPRVLLKIVRQRVARQQCHVGPLPHLLKLIPRLRPGLQRHQLRVPAPRPFRPDVARMKMQLERMPLHRAGHTIKAHPWKPRPLGARAIDKKLMKSPAAAARPRRLGLPQIWIDAGTAPARDGGVAAYHRPLAAICRHEQPRIRRREHQRRGQMVIALAQDNLDGRRPLCARVARPCQGLGQRGQGAVSVGGVGRGLPARPMVVSERRHIKRHRSRLDAGGQYPRRRQPTHACRETHVNRENSENSPPPEIHARAPPLSPPANRPGSCS